MYIPRLVGLSLSKFLFHASDIASTGRLERDNVDSGKPQPLAFRLVPVFRRQVTPRCIFNSMTVLT